VVSYSEKDSYPKDRRQKEGGGQTKNIWQKRLGKFRETQRKLKRSESKKMH